MPACIYCGQPAGVYDEHPGCVEQSISDDAVAEELRETETRYQRAFARSEAERQARNAAVRAALQAGWTHARISEATGLTRARVGQLALAHQS
jgi:hypothetical protein